MPRNRSLSRLAKDLEPHTARTGADITQTIVETGVVDHGQLQGLADDDHTQYFLATGARDLNGNLIPNANNTRTLGSATRAFNKGYLTDLAAAGKIEVGSGAGSMAGGAGSIRYSGLLEALRNGAYCSGAIFVRCVPPIASTAFDGDAFSTVSTPTEIPLASVLGVTPYAVEVRLIARDSAGLVPTHNLHFAVGASASYPFYVGVKPFGADIMIENTGICPCDANGSIWYTCAASGTGTLDVWLTILGFFV